MVVLGFVVDDDGVDGRPLDANRAMHSSFGHRVEGDLVWIVGALQDHLGSIIGSACMHGATYKNNAK